MRLAVFSDHAWQAAAQALGFESVQPALTSQAPQNAPELHRRINAGQRTFERLRGNPPDLLIDRGGEGLQYLLAAGRVDPTQPVEFTPGYRAPLDLKLLHQALGVPLASFFAPTIPLSLAEGQPGIDWQALHSDTWLKLIADQGQAYDLQQLGVPMVLHMPPAAADLDYDTRPVSLENPAAAIAFVGARRSDFFRAPPAESIQRMVPGLLSFAYQRSADGTTFFDAYHALYRMADPPRPGDSPAEFRAKLLAYQAAREAYLAICGVALRDRFVLLLKRQLGDVFRIHGSGWDTTYGLNCEPAPRTLSDSIGLFRNTVINLDLPDEGCESGLSPRAFEITAAGGFLLSLARPEVSEHFEIGRECDVFRDEAELLQKCQYYLGSPDKAAEIAQAGQRRTLSSHLYSHRLKVICERLGLPRPRRATPAAGVFFNLGDWIEDCRAIVPQPDVVLDCGAFTGTTARQLRGAFPRAEIHSFEPVAANFAELEKTADELGVNAVRAAVSDQDGETTINLTVGGQSASLLGFQAERNPLVNYHRITGGEKVPAITLDRWCADHGIDAARIHILKMDIQGAELKALAGARRLLEHVRLVFLEVGFQAFYKDMPLFEDVDAFMRAAGFERQALYPSPAPSVWGDALYVRTTTTASRQSERSSFRPQSERTGELVCR